MELYGTAIKKQGKTTTKKLVTWEVHINKIHTKIGYPGKGRMCVTTKRLHHIVSEYLEVNKDCILDKIKQKLICKVAEYLELKPVEIVYLDIR